VQYAAFEDNDKVYLLQEFAEGVSSSLPATALLQDSSAVHSAVQYIVLGLCRACCRRTVAVVQQQQQQHACNSFSAGGHGLILSLFA
jgi:hypothetical protein